MSGGNGNEADDDDDDELVQSPMSPWVTGHRPYPPPGAPWVMFMRWLDLLFAHWPVDRRTLRPLIHPGLELETFDGQAWLGIVPFVMTATRPRFAPPVVGLSTFPELNVRTYVSRGTGAARRPGIWFFSLDAASSLAVAGARATFHLPYYRARMSARRRGRGASREAADWTDYASARLPRSPSVAAGGRTWLEAEAMKRRGDDHDVPAAGFDARYRPTGPVFNAAPGTFDYWLTERYCLYAADPRGRLFRGEIHHAPWPLRPAEAEIRSNTMTAPLGVTLPSVPPVLHFAQRQDVRAWWRVRVDA